MMRQKTVFFTATSFFFLAATMGVIVLISGCGDEPMAPKPTAEEETRVKDTTDKMKEFMSKKAPRPRGKQNQ